MHLHISQELIALNKTKKMLIFFLLLITIAVCVWPNFHPEKVVFKNYYWQLDVFMHGFYYLTLSMIMRLIVFRNTKLINVFTILFLFSVLLEFAQFCTPGRQVTILDLISNFLGILLGVVLSYKVENRQKQS